MRNPEHEVDVTAELYYCDALSTKEPAKDAVAILRQRGCAFWKTMPEICIDDPESMIDSIDGDLFAGIFHPQLHQSYTSTYNYRTHEGDRFVLSGHREARLVVRRKVRCIWLSCSSYAPDIRIADDIVTAHRQFVVSILPNVRSLYGWIDEAGENAPGDRTIKNIDLRFLFWCNIFGPAYVDKYGRDFLLKAPVWQATDLGEHGVCLTLCESFMRWLDNPCEQVVEYFRTKVPKIMKFRAKPVRD